MQAIDAGALRLKPLIVAHAEAMYEILAEPEIQRYLDHPPPPSVAHLREVYRKLETRRSPDGTQHWLNWAMRAPDGSLLGYVQATVMASQTAWVAYLLASRHRGRGHAATSVRAMMVHLERDHAVRRFLATVEVENRRSIKLLERLGFHAATTAELEGHELSSTECLFVAEPGSESRRIATSPKDIAS